MRSLKGKALERVQSAFVAFLPTLTRNARIWLKPHVLIGDWAEVEQECHALAWKRWRALAVRGVNPARFPSLFAKRIVQAVMRGRRLCPASKSRICDERKLDGASGLQILTITADGKIWDGRGKLAELADPRATRPAELACLIVDVAAFRNRLTDAQEATFNACLRDERTQDQAKEQGVSPHRISQRRRELVALWHRFQAQAD